MYISSTPLYFSFCIIFYRNDEELSKLFGNVTIAEGGVVPSIHSVLIPRPITRKVKCVHHMSPSSTGSTPIQQKQPMLMFNTANNNSKEIIAHTGNCDDNPSTPVPAAPKRKKIKNKFVAKKFTYGSKAIDLHKRQSPNSSTESTPKRKPFSVLN